MINCLANETSHAGLQAQYLVCDHLVRACQQALYEIAVDTEDDQKVRQRAVKILKEIRTDWISARKALRKELASSRGAYSVRSTRAGGTVSELQNWGAQAK